MLPGPDQIVSCLHCGALAKYITLTSGNTFGVRVWTDGKQIEPMMPRLPAVVKCHHCARYYWLEEAKVVGTVEPWGDGGQQAQANWADVQDVQEPTEEEYFEALEIGLAADAQQERELRILAWWRRNDAFRDDSKAQSSGKATAQGSTKKNLEALVCLLHEGDENDQIMRAEVLRELGEFESAKQVLSGVTSAEFQAVVRQLRSLCDSSDICVRELQLSR